MDAGFRARIAEVAERRGLDLVVVHGSRAGAARAVHAGSDLDIAVRAAAGPLDLDDLLDLDADLARAAGDVETDVLDLAVADPLLLKKVFEKAVPVFERPGAFAAERLRAFHRYHDYRPFLALERDAVRRSLGLAPL